MGFDRRNGRCRRKSIGSVIVGILSPDNPSQKYLLTTEVLTAVSSSTIDTLFETVMNLVWPDGIERENVLFVTDAATYMIKAARQIRTRYPNLLHLTCLSHGLHSVAEEIRSLFPDIDSLISNAKKIFLKSPSRKQQFKDVIPLISFPP
ncbi:hypothetical protein ANN_09683 [Periplaneta americana]|uniref:DUF659 domain-containing protein n=1 Tax=Periplaneta americana TaxID=6978 RepID=A0ABQ8TP37_PERAM|nr:hypothetical protein ANN_09683 [Periplaneta americana]